MRKGKFPLSKHCSIHDEAYERSKIPILGWTACLERPISPWVYFSALDFVFAKFFRAHNITDANPLLDIFMLVISYLLLMILQTSIGLAISSARIRI
ncbi:hypothetical protein BDZ91DRAFT_720540 [Kalaharituber pfeilii]|nr:hypothetical protein BDZ91DRAFT_720540 [Kalaharituber pfeilii]